MTDRIITNEMKMICVFSKEAIKLMGGNRGKLASMAGHAYLHAWWDSSDKGYLIADAYRKSGLAKKITLVVETTDELLKLKTILEERDEMGFSLVEDAGRTVFNEPTICCIGIGPMSEENNMSAMLKNAEVFKLLL